MKKPYFSVSRNAVLMLAAVALQRTHGRYYAQCLLEEYGIEPTVILELLAFRSTADITASQTLQLNHDNS